MGTLDAYPVGSRVATSVASIGGRSETAVGTVVEHKRRQLIVATKSHGRIVVAPTDAKRVVSGGSLSGAPFPV